MLKQLCFSALALVLVSTFSGSMAVAQSDAALSSALKDAKLTRNGNQLVRIDLAAEELPLRLPKIFAPVRSATWSVGDQVVQLDVNPEVSHWLLATKQNITGKGTVRIDFDSPPLLADEVQSITASADGSFWLAAHLANTVGEKLRYEPQPFKNTVGYWTQPNDYAIWKFRVEKAGKFNVAVLQGCGVGQGGSSVSFVIAKLDGAVVAEQEFEARETGHFQNFQWLGLQPIEIKESGEYQLKIVPKKIRKSAMMDIRAVQLVKLPG